MTDLNHCTTEAHEQRNGHPSTSDDVWIEIVTPNCAIGNSGRFFGMATVSFPYGMNGPAEARVRFNLSAYVRHEIDKASGLRGDRTATDEQSVVR